MARKPSFKLLLSHNYVPKLLSLLVALLIFSYHFFSNTTTESLVSPLTIYNKSSKFGILNHATRNIKIIVRGQSADVNRFLANAQNPYIAITPKAEGLYRTSVRFSLGTDKVEVRLVPQYVTLHIVRYGQKQIPVFPRFSGTVPEDFRLLDTKILLSPAALLVRGPQSSLDKIDSFQTFPISLQGKTGSFTATTSVEIPKNIVLTDSANIITAKIRIGKIVQQASAQLPVLFSGLGPDLVVQLQSADGAPLKAPSVTAILSGGPKEIKRVLAMKNLFYIEAVKLKDGDKKTLSVHANAKKLPIGVSLMSFSPAEIPVVVSSLPSPRKTKSKNKKDK